MTHHDDQPSASPAERLSVARARCHELAQLNAFISLSSEQFVGAQAGPIVAVKDLIDVRGLPTTSGSRGGSGAPLERDAAVVTRVRGAGGIVIGKTNLYELAFGVTGHNPHHGDVINPWDPERTAGGSSGGSAVAVATGMCDWAIGTDTGGSIRIPASLCGVVGFKPTRGLLSTAGVRPLSRKLDTVGPLARDVLTATRALEILSGRRLAVSEHLRVPRALLAGGGSAASSAGVDSAGASSAGAQPAPVDRAGHGSSDFVSRELRLAVPRGWVAEEELDEPTWAVFSPLAAALPEVDFPDLARISRAASTVLEWEAAAVHESDFRREPERYGQEVAQRLERVLREKRERPEHVYADALLEMLEFRAQVESALTGRDAVLLPATACVAPLRRDRGVREPLARFTRPFNLTGHPALVIPAPSAGLPVGIQLVGPLGGEAQLAAAALALERAWATSGSRAKA
jgi:Asp-tRNA(Asn)/Glu-tRNA(Gln) amidotransferase A subunit family amidase